MLKQTLRVDFTVILTAHLKLFNLDWAKGYRECMMITCLSCNSVLFCCCCCFIFVSLFKYFRYDLLICTVGSNKLFWNCIFDNEWHGHYITRNLNETPCGLLHISWTITNICIGIPSGPMEDTTGNWRSTLINEVVGKWAAHLFSAANRNADVSTDVSVPSYYGK